MSQETLGKHAATSSQTISLLETGVMQMTERSAKRLAPHLGVSPNELFDSPDVPRDIVTIVDKLRGMSESRRKEVARFVEYVAREDEPIS